MPCPAVCLRHSRLSYSVNTTKWNERRRGGCLIPHHKLPAALYPLHQFFRWVGRSIRPALLHSINCSVLPSDVLHLQRSTERFSVRENETNHRISSQQQTKLKVGQIKTRIRSLILIFFLNTTCGAVNPCDVLWFCVDSMFHRNLKVKYQLPP